MYVYVIVYMYMRAYVCVTFCSYTKVFFSIHMYTSVEIYMYIHMYIHLHIHV